MSVLYVADDFGLLPTIDRAIMALAEARALDATSVLINERPRALPELARNRDLHIGLHLDLTGGRPHSAPESIPDLVGADGRFHPLPQLITRTLRGAIRRSSLIREISEQLAALETAIGLTQWDFLAPDVTFDYGASALRAAHPDQLTEVMLHVAHPGEPDARLDDTSYPYAARVAQFERRMTEAGRA